jgi:hypothetical protein
MTFPDCTNRENELEIKQCNWLKEREINNCFARNANNDVVVNGSNPSEYCLDRLLQDAEYKKINLNVDYDYLREIEKYSKKETNKQQLALLYSKLDSIQKTNKNERMFSETINADLDVKKRFTYSALLKLLILACFIILFISTIMINNDTLYDITFTIIMIILIYNLYIFKKT